HIILFLSGTKWLIHWVPAPSQKRHSYLGITVFTCYFSAPIPALNHRGQLDGAAGSTPQAAHGLRPLPSIRKLRIGSDYGVWGPRVTVPGRVCSQTRGVPQNKSAIP